ncbi:MAG: hypothetical protein Q3976_07635 [Corynebacterium sp.]|nr:hypothetical protein [Corynebacterium sp.]
MRVYIPATFAMLNQLAAEGSFHARNGYGFAVTPALEKIYEGDEEELAALAFDDAALASIRLLAVGDEPDFPHRRVVISTDLPDSQITVADDLGDSVLTLSPATIQFDQVGAIHIDPQESEAATAAAIEVIDAADLGDEDAELTVGDCLDNFMAWYDPSELQVLTQLL